MRAAALALAACCASVASARRASAVAALAACASVATADEEYEFWDASAAGDVAKMAEVLDAAPDLDLDYADDDGRTPLLLAVLNERAEAIKFLIDRGADVEATGRWPGPPDGPLAVAAGLGFLPGVDALLEGGANANAATGPDGRTPLVAAAAAGQAATAEALLGVGARADAARGDGSTAAHWAARGGHGAVLQLLLDHGADVHCADGVDGSTVLHYAAQAPTADAVRVAIEAGADVLARSNVMKPKSDDEAPKREDLRGGLTAVMAAAAAASVDALRALLDAAAAAAPSPDAFRETVVNGVDVAGAPALAWAASTDVRGRGGVECLELLYERGARDDFATIDGRLVMHAAAQSRNARALAYLHDVRGHPVDVLSPGKGLTPLIVAASSGSRAAVKALLRRGADVNYAAPDDGATALIAAASGVHKGVCRLLLKKGANPLAQLKSGEFPSQATPKTPHGRMLKYSLSHAERKAWKKLEKWARQAAPPEHEDMAGLDESLIEDLEAGEDPEDGAEAEEVLDADDRDEL